MIHAFEWLLVVLHLFKKGRAFFFNTFSRIQIHGCTPGLPILSHGFSILSFYPFVKPKFKFPFFRKLGVLLTN